MRLGVLRMVGAIAAICAPSHAGSTSFREPGEEGQATGSVIRFLAVALISAVAVAPSGSLAQDDPGARVKARRASTERFEASVARHVGYVEESRVRSKRNGHCVDFYGSIRSPTPRSRDSRREDNSSLQT